MSEGVRIFFFLMIFMASVLQIEVAQASSNAGITYQGRLLDPSGVPVTGSVQFKIQIRTPNTSDCLMYQETKSTTLNSDGDFVLTVNDGTGTLLTGSLPLDQVFANRGTLTFTHPNLTCGGTNTYSPNLSDGRKVIVSFNDGSGWEDLPTMDVNFVPSAIESMQVGGYGSGDLLRVDRNDPANQTVNALSFAEYGKLVDLINGVGTTINSGTIGGSTAINTTGNISAGNITATNVSSNLGAFKTIEVWKADNSQKVTLTVQPTLNANYTLALPLNDGDPGQILSTDGSGTLSWVNDGGGGGGGATSVGLSMPNIFSVTNSPVTTTGSLTASLVVQNANKVFAGPTSGGDAVPTFRTLASDDIPSLNASKINAGQLSVAQGGTGRSTVAANGLLYASALDTIGQVTNPTNNSVLLSTGAVPGWSTGTNNTFLKGSTAGNVTWSAVDLATADVTGTLPVTRGGTGAATLAADKMYVGNAGGTGLITFTCAQNKVLKFDASGNPSCGDDDTGGGGGLTSVGLSMPAMFSVTNSPLTADGSISVSLAVQNANKVLAGPVSGGDAAPGYRSLVANDIPALDMAKITTGTLGVANGGTGAATLTANRILVGNGTSAISALGAGTAGQMLQSAGASAPAWSTATYPATGGTTGTILRSDGTNFVNSTATYPNTISANALLYGSGANAVGQVTAPTNNSVLLSTGAAPTWSTGSNNTFLKGSTAGNVSWSAIDLATADVTGTLPVTRGGTGATSLAADKMYVGNVSGTALQTFTCAQNKILKFDASGNPSCADENATASGGASSGVFAINSNSDNSGSDGGFSFQANTTPLMTISNAGVVDITATTASTSSTTGALTVDGGLGVAGATNIGTTLTAGTSMRTPIIYGSAAASGTLTLHSTSDATKGHVLINPSGGNVGIGTTNPTNLLTLQSPTQYQGFSLRNATHEIATIYGLSAANDTGILALLSGGSRNVQISSNTGLPTFFNGGNVGIGTVAPKEPLSVGLGHHFHLGGSIGHYLNAYWDTTDARTEFAGYGGGSKYAGLLTMDPATGFLSLRTSSSAGAADTAVTFSTGLVMNPSGNVGIGTGSPTTGARFDIYGTGAAESSIVIPRDTVANRPTVGVNGMIRYASDTNKFEAFENGGWVNMIGGGGAAGSGSATGTFTINSNSDASGSDGGFNFQANGSSLMTISNAGVVDITATTASTSSTTGALTVDGGLGVAGAANIGTTLAAGTSMRTPIIYGSAAASGTLTLHSTSDATKGHVLINPSGGNVGMGTLSPQQQLHITGNFRKDFTNTSGTSGSTAAYWMMVNNDGAANWSEYLNSTGTASPTAATEGASFRRYFSPTLVGGGGNIFYHAYATPVLAGAAQTWKTYLEVNAPSDSLSLMTGGGNVGIGTGAPREKIDVVGANALVMIGHNANNAGTVGISFAHTTASDQKKTAILSEATGSWGKSNLHFALDSASDTGNVTTADAKMTILNSGNVGIGTTSPKQVLDVNGVMQSPGLAMNSYFDGAWKQKVTGYSGYWQHEASTGVLYYWNTSASVAADATTTMNPRFVVDKDGNVGIGTTVATYKLQVKPTHSTGRGLFLDKYNNTEGGELVLNDNTKTWSMDVISGHLRFITYPANDSSPTADGVPFQIGPTGSISIAATSTNADSLEVYKVWHDNSSEDFGGGISLAGNAPSLL